MKKLFKIGILTLVLSLSTLGARANAFCTWGNCAANLASSLTPLAYALATPTYGYKTSYGYDAFGRNYTYTVSNSPKPYVAPNYTYYGRVNYYNNRNYYGSSYYPYYGTGYSYYGNRSCYGAECRYGKTSRRDINYRRYQNNKRNNVYVNMNPHGKYVHQNVNSFKSNISKIKFKNNGSYKVKTANKKIKYNANRGRTRVTYR